MVDACYRDPVSVVRSISTMFDCLQKTIRHRTTGCSTLPIIRPLRRHAERLGEEGRGESGGRCSRLAVRCSLPVPRGELHRLRMRLC